MSDRLKQLLKQNHGYTIIESLTAWVLLVIVLLPASIFFARMTGSQICKNLIIAVSITRSAMEETIAGEDFTNKEWQVHCGKRVWQIERVIAREQNLVHITIRSRPLHVNKWTFSLYTCRLAYDG